MSISSYGIFILKEEFSSLEDKIDFSFVIQRLANENRVGINQGGNISIHSWGCLEEMYGKDPCHYEFELADDPLDFNAEYLFWGYDFDPETEEQDRFEARIKRVKDFFENVFATNLVKQIDLFINTEPQDDYEVFNLDLETFCEIMTQRFIESDGWTPSLKVIVKS